MSVTNPLDEILEFEVELRSPGLFGDPLLTLGPQETGVYQFVFSPLVPGDAEGSITFVNEKAGEFWYVCMDGLRTVTYRVWECGWGVR